MCGILGFVNFDVDHRGSLNHLIHRGPDDFGEYFDQERRVYLGHRRLSILDLSEAGRQPMALEDGEIIITYNGEIYNFKSIQQNHLREDRFFSRTDTEVLLRLYKKYGTKAVGFLRGMFAFGIYDKRNAKILLCRDRVGIKPLFYYFKDGKFAFSSELSALKAAPGIDLEIDPTGLDYYFSIGYIPSPYTAYKHIRKLPPAHILLYDVLDSQIDAVRPYWTLRTALGSISNWKESQWIEAIEEKIRESVKLHLVSDVPLGVFLSGGLDSSLVVATMASIMDTPAKTFTMGFEHCDYDEREYALAVAEQYGTDHHEELVNPDSFGIMSQLVHSFGEPFYDSSAIPTYYVSRMARKEVTVVLSGDGGDEVFAGYRSYERMHRYAMVDKIPFQIRKAVRKLAYRIPEHLKGYGFLQRQGYNGVRRFHEMEAIFRESDKESLYTQDFKRCLSSEENILFSHLYEKYNLSQEDLITQLQYIDFHSYLPDDILTKVDRMSMMHSLEARVPLLDHELVELMFSCPPAIRFKNSQLKYITKRILEKKVSKEVLMHKKQGFALPICLWFRDKWKKHFYSYFTELSNDDFIHQRYAIRVLEAHQKGGRDFSTQLYALLFYKMWRDETR